MTPRLPIEVYGGAVYMDQREAFRQCDRACRETASAHAVVAVGNGWAVVRIHYAAIAVEAARRDVALVDVVERSPAASSQLERFAALVGAGVDPKVAARSGRGEPS